MLRPGACAVLVIVPLGCAGGIDVRERADAGATSRTRDAVVEDSHETVLPPCEPTFASIQRNVFDIACSEGTCHGPPTPAWGLILTDGRALDRLVGKASGSCGEFFLVTPGVPAESFLWLKISSDKPPCGERMPFGGKRLPEWSRACIHDWISGLGTRHDASIDSARRD